MRATLIFNNMNDLVFWRWDALFVKHVLHLARVQGLIPTRNDSEEEEDEQASEINPDVVIQIFSPVITSQRIMSCQFGNSYSSVQCRDGTNIVFDEYVGYLFVHISKGDSICWMQKSIGICISVVKYFCGPDVSLLKQERQRSGVAMVLNSWERLCFRDQSALVGASECIIAGSQAMSSSFAALKAVTASLPPPSSTAHTAIFVQNKLLSLYSTRGADDLSPADNIFFGIMSAAAQDKWSRRPPTISSSRSPSPTDDDGDEQPFDGDDFGETLSWTVLLGNSSPHALHLHRLSKNITLVIAIALGNNAAGNVANAIHALLAATVSLAQRDIDSLKQTFNPLDIAMKKALDSLKKNKSHPESPQKKLQSQWETVRRRLSEFLREGTGSWPNLEAIVSSLAVGLKTAFHLACRGFAPPDIHMRPISLQAHTKLTPLYKFLRVRAIGSFTLGSTPAMSKYIEEFPGLVHFIYINRGNHRLIAPTLPNCSHMLSRKKIWAMVERTRSNLQEGHLSSMWKDGALHYAHLVWFEDTTGAPAKPKPITVQMLSSLPSPNIFPEDYYMKLTEVCFPCNFRSIRCYELIAIHIGLLPAGTALAHVRRLAVTVTDITTPTHPINLL